MDKSKLVITDLHFTSNEEDSYRWSIFEHLAELLDKHKIQQLLILGDLTEKKDRHSASLVNRLFDNICFLSLLPNLENIFILCGNHDYSSKEHPFFEFTSGIPKVKFITDIFIDDDCLYVPYNYSLEELEKISFSDMIKNTKIDTLFLHHVIEGACWYGDKRAEDTRHGFLSLSSLQQFKNVYSGHIHTAQEYKNVTYIGAPYHIDYEDTTQGRCLLLPKNEFIYFDSLFPKKLSFDVSSIEELNLISKVIKPKDFLKVNFLICTNDRYKITDLRNEVLTFCKKYDIVLTNLNFSLNDTELEKEALKTKYVHCNIKEQIINYCKENNLSEAFLSLGLSFISN